MGLLDFDMSTPQGQGFNNALLAAAQALLTPRSRGGGMGAAFGAFPQAIDRAKANAMREQLMALQEQQMGMQGQKLGFDMDEARRKAAQQQTAQARFDQLLGQLPEAERATAELVGPSYFEPKTLAPGASLVSGGRTIAQAPNKPEAKPELVRLLDMLYPEGHPLRAAYMEKYLNKQTTHAPAAMAISYGSPVPVQLPDGSVGYAQPGNREGAPPQLMMQPGTNTPLTKPPAPPTDTQANANLFLSRMVGSDSVLQNLETSISREGLAAKQAAESVPLIGGALSAGANYALSPNQQKVEQAQRDFLNAVLRKESGAVISKEEFANANKQYFPQPGDSKAVIEQKRKNRQTAISGFRVAAGPVLGKKPQASSVPTIGDDADYDALPSGAEFIAPDGSRRRKP